MTTFKGTLTATDDSGQTMQASIEYTAPPPEERPPWEPPDRPDRPPIDGGGEQPPGDSEDGSANAPAGAPQFPDVLNAYQHRPNWKVAGVHYRVGPPQGQVFADPATAQMPAGVTRDTRNKTLTIIGANVTLDGLELSDWQILVKAAGFKLRNSKAKLTRGYANSGPIRGWHTARDMVIEYCDLDGMGPDGQMRGISALVYTDTEGSLLVQYCLLQNSVSDFLDMGLDPAHKGELVPEIRFNVAKDCGCAPGAHGDFPQFQCKQVRNLNIHHNTVLFYYVGAGPQGIQVQAQQGGRFDEQTSNVHHNVLIAGPAIQGKTMSYAIAYVGTTGRASDNYFDIAAAWGAFYPPGPRIECERNINMRTGRTIQADNSER